MTDGSSTARTGKTAVRDHGDRFLKAHADEHSRGNAHFPHAWSAFGPFITDDEYGPRFDVLMEKGFHHFFFGIKNDGRTAVNEHGGVDAAFLDYGTLWGSVRS